MPVPLTLITVELVGDRAEGLHAFSALRHLIADAVETLDRTSAAVAEIRAGRCLIGRVIVSNIAAEDGLRRDLSDPDAYMRG